MEKTNKLTFQEHQIIGLIAKLLNNRLLFSSPKYPTKVQGRKCPNIKANKHLSNFKSYMENIMFRDCKNEATTNIYYGDRPEDGDIIKHLKELLSQQYPTKSEQSKQNEADYEA